MLEAMTAANATKQLVGNPFLTELVFGLVLLFSIGFLVSIVLARKMPYQFLWRALRWVLVILLAPFRLLLRPLTRLLQFLRVVPQDSPHQDYVGPSAWATLTRASRPHTDTEKALGPELADGEKNLRRYGLLYRWMHVEPAYVPDVTDFSDAVADVYLEESERFFSCQVPIFANPQSLYEDVDGAITVNLFGRRDGSCFYLLNEMRKIINANVRKLTVLYSTIIALVLIVNLFFQDAGLIDFHRILGLGNGFLGMTIDAGTFNRASFGVMLCVLGALAMWLLFYIEYIPYQRNNSREMKNYLTRYLARLNDRYTRSIANARSVTVGDECDPRRLSSDAQRWHKIIIWIAFRAFFIEGFIRNAIFQIKRNSGYYVFYVPLLFTVVLVLVAALFSAFDTVDVIGMLTGLSPAFFICFAALIWLYSMFLSRSMTSIEEMDQLDWLGFDNMRLDNAIGQVVGKYAEDVGYWKSRIRGGSDGP